LSVMNSSRQLPPQEIRSLQVGIVSVNRMISLKPFPVVPNTWSFKRLPLPPILGSDSGPSSIPLIVKQGVNADWEELGFLGRLDHRLYRWNPEEDNFEVAYRADPRRSGVGEKYFPSVSRPTPEEVRKGGGDLYVAIETFYTVPEFKPVSESIQSLDVEVLFLDLPVDESENVRVRFLQESSPDVLLFKFIAPERLVGEPKALQGYFWMHHPELDEVNLQIPFTVLQ